MSHALAGVAAAAVAVAALGGCTSSGTGSGGSSGSAPATAGGTSPATSAAPPTASSAAPSQSMTAIKPLRPITCAALPHRLGRFHRGGALPSGVPLPQAVPTLTCAGPSGVVAAVWSSVNAGQYRQQLTATGWHASGTRFRKPGAPKTIVVASVQAALVAVYRPA